MRIGAERKRLTRIALAIIAIFVALFVLLLSRKGDKPMRLPHLTETASPPLSEDALEQTVPQSSVTRTRAATVALPPIDEKPAKSPEFVNVSGRVVDQATDTPIAGATVACEPALEKVERSTVHVETDASGRFELAVPLDGTRCLHVSAADHAPVWISTPHVRPEDGPLQPDAVDYDDIRMVRGGRPTVRVFDSEGAPAAHAELYSIESDRPRSGIVFLGVTDQSGEWHAPCPLAGGGWSMVIAFHDEGLGWKSTSAVEPGQQETLLDIHMWPSPRIVFHVRDTSGASIAGATVELMTECLPFQHLTSNTPAYGSPTGWPFKKRLQAMTDASGNATLRVGAVPAKSFTWNVSARRSSPPYGELKGLRSVDPKPQEIVVGTGSLVHAVTGTVLDEDGRPVPGASVKLLGKSALTDPLAGSFRIDLDVPLQASVATPASFAPGYVIRSAKVRDEKQDPLDVDFVMARTWTISGIVLDEAGSPIAKAGVQAGEQRGHSSAYTRTKADGSFILTAPWKTELLQLLVMPGPEDTDRLLLAESTMTRGESNKRIVLLRDPDPPRGSLHARVLDGATRTPVPVIDVRLSGAQGMPMQRVGGPRSRTFETGHFEAKPLMFGDWHAWVLSTERRVALAEFRVDEEHPDADIEVLVEPLRAIRGRLMLDGKPLIPPAGEAISVWAYCEMGTTAPVFGPWKDLDLVTRRDTHASADGSFVIEELPPATWNLIARGANVEGKARVRLETGRDTQFDFRVHRISEKAWIELTNLDSRFETPLLLRVERGGMVTEEYETDPAGQHVQTFPVDAGAITMTVIPIPAHNGFPAAGAVPIKKDTLVLAPGETHSYALYPR